MRYSDASYSQGQGMDFIPRNYQQEAKKLVIAYSLAVIIVVIIAALLVATGKSVVGIACIILVLIGLGAYTLYLKQANVDLLQATEFQNALFSSAADIGYDFTMILRQDGTIVHSSSGLQRMFPEVRSGQDMLLDTVFDMGEVSGDDRTRIKHALSSNQAGRVMFVMQDAETGAPKRIILSIVPLPRPRGFFVVRGRELVEREGAAAPQNTMPQAPQGGGQDGTQANAHYAAGSDVVSIGSGEYLPSSALLELSDQPLYATSADGLISYVTPAFEALTHYSDSDIMARSMRMNDLLHRTEVHNTGEFVSQPYHGTAMIETKNGALVRVSMRQEEVRSDDGTYRLMGFVGSLRRIEG